MPSTQKADHAIGLTAVDFYAGVGGWSAGVQMAGMNVVAAFERWQPAILTYQRNIGSHVHNCDIRSISKFELPDSVDVVIGSPPCTEFSYSNRGGNGNCAEGLRDIEAFLAIVEILSPRYWVMENVPRVSRILEGAIQTNGPLEKFAYLIDHIDTVDMSEFGLPQRRRRCIVGRYPRDLLFSYRALCPKRTLGEVLGSFSEGELNDHTFGIRVRGRNVTDNDTEPHLTDEEVRMNRDAKNFHPVYNDMQFPEPLDQPSRTITATCTRVSRESLIVDDRPPSGKYRRLTVRERACLQGFPGPFRFFASSYSNKLKLVGNALPPLFSYYVACALQGIDTKDLVHPSELKFLPKYSRKFPPATPPSGNKASYPCKRRFRAALPNLRFKSGIRFELFNEFQGSEVCWRIVFLFGTPSDIRFLDLDEKVISVLRSWPQLTSAFAVVESEGDTLMKALRNTSADMLQKSWRHMSSGIGPYEIVDKIGALSLEVMKPLQTKNEESLFDLLDQLLRSSTHIRQRMPNEKKLRQSVKSLIAGLVVGAWFNTRSGLDSRQSPIAAE